MIDRARQLLQKMTPVSYENVHAKRISDVPVLTERERNRILCEWNDTRAEFPDVWVHELFEQQVALDPESSKSAN